MQLCILRIFNLKAGSFPASWSDPQNENTYSNTIKVSKFFHTLYPYPPCASIYITGSGMVAHHLGPPT